MSPAAFLDAQQVVHQHLAPWFAEMAQLHEQKLWHQLTSKLENFVALSEAQEGEVLLPLYQNFISEFESKINPLKLAHLAVVVSRKYPNPEEALPFLQRLVDKLQGSQSTTPSQPDQHSSASASADAAASSSGRKPLKASAVGPVLYLRMQQAALYLQSGEASKCKGLLEEAEGQLEQLDDVDPSVHASVYWVKSQFHKARQDFADFYRAALSYLAYAPPLSTLSDEFKQDLAVDLSLSALLGEGVYNFGELLAHPIIPSSLPPSSPFYWLHLLLLALHSGDIPAFSSLSSTHAQDLAAQPALVAHAAEVEEKMRVMALLDVLANLPPEDRSSGVPLPVLSAKTSLDADGTERLIMKALAAGLIRGSLDSVSSSLSLSWVQPRTLSLPQAAALRVRLDSWLTRVHATLLGLEGEAPDLLAGASASAPPPPPPSAAGLGAAVAAG